MWLCIYYVLTHWYSLNLQTSLLLMISEFLYLDCMFLSVALFHVNNHSPVVKPLLLCLLLSICRMSLHTFCIFLWKSTGRKWRSCLTELSPKLCMNILQVLYGLKWIHTTKTKLKTCKFSYMRFVVLDASLWVLSSNYDFPLYHFKQLIH